jgi:hypothetical protein
VGWGGGGRLECDREWILRIFDHFVEILQLLCDRVPVPYLLRFLSFVSATHDVPYRL